MIPRRKIKFSKPHSDLSAGALKLLQSCRKTHLYLQVTPQNLVFAAELVTKGYGWAQDSYAIEDRDGIEIKLSTKALKITQSNTM